MEYWKAKTIETKKRSTENPGRQKPWKATQTIKKQKKINPQGVLAGKNNGKTKTKKKHQGALTGKNHRGKQILGESWQAKTIENTNKPQPTNPQWALACKNYRGNIPMES